MAVSFNLPQLNEGVTEATVVKIAVATGDTVAEGDIVLEIETNKAIVEVPATVSGVVKEVLVAEGDAVKTDQPILSMAGDDAGTARVPKPQVAPDKDQDEDPEELKAKVEPKIPLKPEPEEPPPIVEQPTPSLASQPPREGAQPQAVRSNVPAAPSVRRFAREIGIDISQVPGSGPGGRISEEDVKSYARQQRPTDVTPSVSVPTTAPAGLPALPDFSQWGETDREPMGGVRRKTAEHLSLAWNTVPHVTQFATADITELEELRKRYSSRVESAGAKLTVTAILLKVLAAALKAFPKFNASVDMANQAVIYKKYVHIGVAVDTPRGLLVPVIRDVDRKSLVELSIDLGSVADKARNGKLTLDEMQGGCFTLSNLGGIGGSYFTPIVNYPEVAILGVGRANVEPVYVDGELKPRKIMPLALSYDHRLIDGADGARFIRWVVEAIEQPFLMALGG